MAVIVSARVEVKVPFHDCDPMGITWHGNYLRYFELARCELLDKLDYNYRQMEASGYRWPIIDVKIRYPQPTEFEQQLHVYAELIEWEQRLRIRYRVCDAASGRRLVKGETVQVAVSGATGEMCLASPPVLKQRLLPWLDA
ncbi:acyl-CoA thioesterase [Ferrimonas kyonanensis]|uniref:acyl-CoA thioesterase n=1 Tax=Ferrimonas kyonanensis TaxID=364763 RepID=UPI0004263B83|nr:acyl-CoA thioesterase [Ferrimonas kyonanensis]